MRLMVFVALLTLSACATVTADAYQNISVTTEPAGAACTLRNDVGQWSITETPGTASVKRSFSPLRIHCSNGTAQGEATIEAKTRGRAYGNIALGGIPAIVDAGTGKGYEYALDHIVIALN